MIKQKQLSSREIEKAIFEGIYPTYTINIGPLTLIFVINDGTNLPKSVEDWFNFFANACFIPGFKDSRVFLREIPFTFFDKLVQKYIKFYNNWMLSVLLYMPQIIISDKSKMAWRVFTQAPIEKVLPVGDRLNTAQYYWVVFNTVEDQKDRTGIITNLFEAVKPWLNTELWNRMEEAKAGKEQGRVNRFYEEKIRKFDEQAGLCKSQNNDIDDDTVTMETN